MKVNLINYSNDGSKTIELAAKSTRGKYHDSKNKPIDTEYIKRIVKSGHYSILEHFTLSFRIENVSRALSHQFVRHRIGISVTQESQRYVEISSKKHWYVIPSKIQKNENALKIFENTIHTIQNAYKKLIDSGIPAEDARFLLPNATHTSFVFSANIRSLFHLFDFRLCKRAQWEIRKLAYLIYELCLDFQPHLFLLWIPRCKNCPERCEKPIYPEIKNIKEKYEKREN